MSPTVQAHLDNYGSTIGRVKAEAIAASHGTTLADLREDEGLKVTPGPARAAGSATTHRSGYVRTKDLFGALGY